MSMITSVTACLEIVVRLSFDLAGPIALSVTHRRPMEAENLFLRREFAVSKERDVRHKLFDISAGLSLALRSRQAGWRDVRIVVPPETMIRGKPAGWHLLWRLKSRQGNLPIFVELRRRIQRTADEKAA